MDQNYNAELPGGQTSNIHNDGRQKSGSRIWQVLIGIGLLFVALVGVYSFFVAMHEPDPQETLVLGQNTFSPGGTAGLRILVRNRVSGVPIKGAQVELSLCNPPRISKLGRFQTDVTGSVGDVIRIPELVPGQYDLVLDTKSALGSDHIIKKVELRTSTRVFLTSDKPIYQPGQTLHLRTMVIDARTQKPLDGETVTFEVKDPKGNKVFKESRKASKFGIASADFVLATELNLGRYGIEATAGAGIADRAVEVKRYVLPKYKIQIKTDHPYYLPGQSVTGSVQAGYFFGRPVSGGEVKLTVLTLQEKPVAITELSGKTDSNGQYGFQFTLPDTLVGMPQNNEQAFLDLKAELRDAAGHVEETTLSLSVARNELQVVAIPEAGVLVPGVENVLYVLTSYPDGRVAACRLTVDGKEYRTDGQGVCEVRLAVPDVGRNLRIEAIDPAGKRAWLAYSAETNGPVPAFMLRTDKAVYQAGQTAHISIVSPESRQTVFIDVIKEGRTVLTKSVEVVDHKAAYSLSLPASLVGTLSVNAYVISSDGEDRGCSRMVYVNPASGLRIATHLSKPVFRPGEMARLDFSVTDAENHPVPAALGIAAVDESVFAMAESRPGLLQQFLDAEGDLLKPRYQIKQFDSPGMFLSGDGERQLLAQAYFASFGREPGMPGLDQLVKDGLIPRKLIDHAQSMRGTPGYERLRKDPNYAAAMRLLEDRQGLYTLREDSGPVKLQMVEAARKAYFRKLRGAVELGLCGLLFLSPVFLLLHYSRPGAGINAKSLKEQACADYLRLAGACYNQLTVLILLPVVCYPVGLFMMAEWFRYMAPWWLLLFETVALVVTLVGLFGRTRMAEPEGCEGGMRALRAYLVGFLITFLVSRGVFVGMAVFPNVEGRFVVLWFALSLLIPIAMLAGLNSYVRSQLAARNIVFDLGRIRVIEVLVVVVAVMILAAMLLPALSKAKSKAQVVSLMNDLRQLDIANQMALQDRGEGAATATGAPRVRRDFPETLLWRPELITDDAGKASLEIPLADSITTWRATVDGISAAGKMGSAEVPINVFQDFFVDLDLPVSMALGDQVTVPVACYNYLKEAQDIRLAVDSAAWFESPLRELSVHLEPGEVKSVGFCFKVLGVGNHTLRVTARGTKLSDAIEREIRVVPTGEERSYTQNGTLQTNWSGNFVVPTEAIPASQNLWVKLYPTRFSEIVEGLDSIFQAPYGCFEQTSSTTYPNVLVLDYMKRTGRITPEIEVKARKFINAGYQRLLTFEVPGGGFDWFGRSPANVCLTAYGILEFTDMARVHPVDPAMVVRTRNWLFAQQNNDGSWKGFQQTETWSGANSLTVFVAWALAESGDQSENLDRALNYLRNHQGEISSMYSKALAANAFLAHDRNDRFGLELAEQLKNTGILDSHKKLHWSSGGCSATYSRGPGLDVETTALAAMALMKAGSWPESVKQAMTWLSHEKASNGTWGSTQATILAMRALLEADSTSQGQQFDSVVTVCVNGQSVESLHINKENSDVMRLSELTRHLRAGDNRIELRQNPSGELAFQVTGAYWLPGAPTGKIPAHLGASGSEPMRIQVEYDRTTLSVNDQLHCRVAVHNNTAQVINMAIVDLGIPPGFDVDSDEFEAFQKTGMIAKFEITGNQVILYLRELLPGSPFELKYSLRAKYPLRVQTPISAVYEYYQPSNRAQSGAVMVEAHRD